MDITNTDMEKQIESCITKLKSYGETVSFPKLKTIISDGECSEYAYIIEKGTVRTIRYTLNGSRRIYWDSTNVSVSDPIVLLAAAITGRPASVNVIAHTRVTLIKISRDKLLSAMHDDPVISSGVAYILASRFMDVSGNLHKSEEVNFEQRFLELLINYAMEIGVPYDNKILLNTRISQQSMADFLHVDRTTVARCIKKLKEENLIERINDLYCIKDLNALKKKYMSITK